MDKFKLHQCVHMAICVAIVTLLPNCITETMQSQREREILASTEIPVDHIDPGSIDLTPLINALLNATNTDSQNLFSVLSVTSHSSLALHKITILVYNISDFQDIETSTFPLRYCYCVTNKTNDLTDFTAILLDVMGNSTSYLQELFKSSSFLSVSQRRDSDCIYICVLAGKTDRNLTELWDSVPPLFNQTFIETAHKGNISFLESFFVSSTHSAISFPSKSPATTEVSSPTSIPSSVPTSGHMSSFHTHTPTKALTTVVVTPPSAATTFPTSPVIPMTTQLALLTGSTGIALPTATTETHVSGAYKTLITTATVGSTTSDVTVATSRSAHAATELLLKTSADTTTGLASAEAIHTEPATTADSTRNVATMSRSAHAAAEILSKTSAATTTGPAIGKALHSEEPGCPWRSELFYRRSEMEDLKENPDEDLSQNSPTISTIKLQPCVFELCKFFSQCLCRGLKQKSTLRRYCVSSHFWYEKHTLEICSRVKRVAFSKNLKQTCLARMCGKM